MLNKGKIGRVVASGLGVGVIGGLVIVLMYFRSPVAAQESSNPGAQVISGKEFHLVDQQGKARAVLALSEKGEPYLSMIDRNGIAVVWLGIAEDSGLAIRDADGKTRLVLTLNPAGQPSLVVRDRQHRTRSFQPE